MKNIKHWYLATFHTDTLGLEISELATFEGLENNLPNVYDYLNVGDSIIRERVFNELAKRLKVNYTVVYDKWLYS